MEKLYFADDTSIEIQEGASISVMVTILDGYEELQALEDKITKANNLDHLIIKTDDEISATYDNMTLYGSLFSSIDKVDGKIYVTLGFREKTPEELETENLSKTYEENKEAVALAITYLSDEQALTVAELYPTFKSLIGQTLDNNTRFTYLGEMYKTIQDDLLIQKQYKPGEGTGALYVKISDGSHTGTQEDPIPVPDNVKSSGFEYEYGKYYKEGEKIYLAKREGKNDGEKEILYFPPSELIGQYFETAE